jgi:hypothetical protein
MVGKKRLRCNFYFFQVKIGRYKLSELKEPYMVSIHKSAISEWSDQQSANRLICRIFAES